MKVTAIIPICLGLIAIGAANSQIATPSVGYVRYGNQEVHGIHGLEGNYIVGQELLASATAASFSDDGGLLFHTGSLSLVDSKLITVSTMVIDDADPSVRIDGKLTSAIAYLPATHALVHWNGGSFVKTPIQGFSDDSTVTSIRKLDENTASLLVSKPDGTIARFQISLQTGELKSTTTVPGASATAFEDGTRVLCFQKGQLSVLSEMGETLQVILLPTDDRLTIEQVSNRCFHLSTGTPGQDWLLHTGDKDLHLYRLPGPRKTDASVSEAQLGSAK